MIRTAVALCCIALCWGLQCDKDVGVFLARGAVPCGDPACSQHAAAIYIATWYAFGLALIQSLLLSFASPLLLPSKMPAAPPSELPAALWAHVVLHLGYYLLCLATPVDQHSATSIYANDNGCP